jgi:copper chaperone NosL
MPRHGRHMSRRGTGRLKAAGFTLLLSACSGDPGTGPVDVKWDRDSCARCNMVLSDRQHAAQVRHTPADGGRSEVRRFDDFGCAVLWLDKQVWANDASVEIWVTDQHSGQWIDARTAHYTPGRITPMQYGLGAQAEASADALDFTRAREHVYAIERRFNIHGGNLDHPNAVSPLPPIPAGDSAGAQ